MLSRQNGAGVEALVPFFMLVLLAESKTMSNLEGTVDDKILAEHLPVFENTADGIMTRMESLSPADISSILGISHQLSVKAHNLAYEFSHKATGYEAIYGFTGEAFRSLDAKTLTPEALNYSKNNLQFISSVYGLLKSSDIIKPYRCEFNKPVAPDNKTPIQIFKPKITTYLVNYIKDNKVRDIINLLPADADKCIDWKIVRAFAKVHKICFQTITPEGKLKTPIAKRLKELRGLMAREILLNQIDSFQELTNIRSEHFIFSADDSKPLLPVFIAD